MKKKVHEVRVERKGDDFYDYFEVALEDDEITATEAAFMEGFTES